MPPKGKTAAPADPVGENTPTPTAQSPGSAVGSTTEPAFAPIRRGSSRRIAAAMEKINAAVKEGCVDLERFIQVEDEETGERVPFEAVAQFRAGVAHFSTMIDAILYPPVAEPKEETSE